MPVRPEISEMNLQYRAKSDLYKIGIYRKLRPSMDMSWLLGFQAMLLAVNGNGTGKSTKDILQEHTTQYARSCVQDKLPNPQIMLQSFKIGMKSAHSVLLKSRADTILDDIKTLHDKLGLLAQELETYVTGNTRRIYDRAKTRSGIIVDP